VAKIDGDGVRLEWTPLDDIPTAELNPKEHDVEGITQSILDYGFTDPLLLDERTGRLIAGEGRLGCLKRLLTLGAKVPLGVRECEDHWEVQVRRGWHSRNDHEALGRLLADNGLPAAGGNDPEKLLEALSTIAGDASEFLRSTGHTSDDLDRLLAEVGTKPEPRTPPPSPVAPWDRDDVPDPFDRPAGNRPLEDWQPTGGGHTVETTFRSDPDESPGPLTRQPVWRLLQPSPCAHHSHGRAAIERVAGGLPVVEVDGVYKVCGPGDTVLAECHPDHWLERDGQTGKLTEYHHPEFLDRFVPANEEARRRQRDAEVSPRHERKS
jgi:hypothetical protein